MPSRCTFGESPSQVTTRLDAQQIDSQQRLEDSWGEVRDHLTELFDWSGLKGIEAEELTVFPGMDEIFSLASVRDHARFGQVRRHRRRLCPDRRDAAPAEPARGAVVVHGEDVPDRAAGREGRAAGDQPGDRRCRSPTTRSSRRSPASTTGSTGSATSWRIRRSPAPGS